MSAPDQPSPADPVAVAAAAWLARRDRGFTPAEQDEFLLWLAADPRHRAEMARIGRSWRALDGLAAWQPADGTAPNPDLLAPPSPRPPARWRRLLWPAGALAASGLACAVWLGWPDAPPAAAPAPLAGLRVIPRPEPLALEDGSVAEVNHGGRMELAFGAGERRVRLTGGEVHFTVKRDPGRPFVVEAGNVTVRAVGTAFSVHRTPAGVEVLVTEGRVEVKSSVGAPVPVGVGERARIGADLRPAVGAAQPEMVERALAWRAVRLEFDGLPLAAVVTEFNLRNVLQLEIGDGPAGRLRVAGTFRADKPEAFARLLEAGFGIAVERRSGAAWVLRSAKRENEPGR
jgi:transmembrane sensor